MADKVKAGSPARGDLAFLDMEAWIKHTLSLLELERSTELEAFADALRTFTADELEAAGITLRSLEVAEFETGLFGRTILTVTDANGKGLPANKLSAGDTVGVLCRNSLKSVTSTARLTEEDVRELYDCTGVVTQVTDRLIKIAVDEEGSNGGGGGGGGGKNASGGKAASTTEAPELFVGDRVRLDRLLDGVTFQRLKAALQDMAGFRHGPASRLVRLLFGKLSDADWPLFEQPAGSEAEAAAVAAVMAGRDEKLSSRVARVSLEEGAASSSSSPSPSSSSISPAPLCFTPLSSKLNTSQLTAVDAALRAKDICYVMGPPGTGKTTTIVEIIRQEVLKGKKVLACAPSNIAVDNLLQRLAQSVQGTTGKGGAADGIKMLRLGHPARMQEAILPYCLDSLVKTAEGTAIVQDVRKELKSVGKAIRTAKDKGSRRELRAEERKLKQEVRKREETVLRNVIRSADVVLATCTGATSKLLRSALTTAAGGAGAAAAAGGGLSSSGLPLAAVPSSAGGPAGFRGFDIVVIDEVAQALEAACWIPMLQGSKAILAGDHCQLPPTVQSPEAEKAGLGFTLADKVVARFSLQKEGKEEGREGKEGKEGKGLASSTTLSALAIVKEPVVHMLQEQYRMHSCISDWSSKEMYAGKLFPHSSVAGRLLTDLPNVKPPAEGADVVVTGEQMRSLIVGAKTAAQAGLEEAKESAAEAAAAGAGAAGGRGKGGTSSSSGSSATLAASTARALQDSTGELESLQEGDVAVEQEALMSPMLLIDTAGCDLPETSDAHSESKSNIGEAAVLLRHVLALLNLGVRPEQMAVVTPYNAQVGLLRAMLNPSFPALEIRSIDGFQGQEKEAIILSLVRSNSTREVGFLRDYRRMNVAVTRAKMHVAIIADSDTVSSDPFLARLLAYVEEQGQSRSASEYMMGMGGVGAGGGGGGGGGGKRGGAARASAPRPLTNKEILAAKEAEKKEREKLMQKCRSLLQDLSLLMSCRERLQGMQEEESPADASTASADSDREPFKLPSCSLSGAGLFWKRVAPSLQTAESAGVAGAEGAERGVPPLEWQLQLSYPCTLSGADRAMLHIAATTLQLQHQSIGSEKDGSRQLIMLASAADPEAAETADAAVALGGGVPAAVEVAPQYAAKSESGKDFEKAVDTVLRELALIGAKAKAVKAAAKAAQAAKAAAATNSIKGQAPKKATTDFSALASDSDSCSEEEEEQEEQAGGGASAAAGDTGTAGATTAGSALSKSQKKKQKKKSKEGQVLGSAADAPAFPAAGGQAVGLLPAGASPAAAGPAAAMNSVLGNLAKERQARAEAAAKAAAAAAPAANAAAAAAAAEKRKALSVHEKPAQGKAKAKPPQDKLSAVLASAMKEESRREGGAAAAAEAAGAGAAGAASSSGADAAGKKKTNKKKKKQKKANTGKAAAGDEDGSDDDDEEEEETAAASDDPDLALLDAVLAVSSFCQYGSCKKKITTLGQTCKFCRLRFCIEHGLAEDHGCGEKARDAARKAWLAAGAQTNSSMARHAEGPAAGQLHGWKRDAVSSKLQKKLEEAAAERTGAGKDGKDGKKKK